jgi:transcriptional regulator with XRE-family HTH domain
MTQQQLAVLLGVSQPQIAKLESGRAKNLELRTLYRWATALGAKLSIGIEADNGRRRARVAVG